MYQALYRKWRPSNFDEVVGQEHITEALKSQIESGRISHAYLFIGTRGTGKTSCAKIMAKAVNCESPVKGNPCNECKACRGIDNGSIMDVEELDAASNNGVDNVRALRDEAVFSPASVKKRVYIVDEVHMLSTSAFNALLKILEEPPPHLMFILATTELNKIPATILSRCQRHSFKRLSNQAVADRLKLVADAENISLQPDAAELLARLADGAMRDGLSLMDQCAGYGDITTESVLAAMGLSGNHRTSEILESIATADSSSALIRFNELWQDGKAPTTFLDELSVLIRDILLLKKAPTGGEALLRGGYDIGVLKSLGKIIPGETLIYYLDLIQNAISAIKAGANQRVSAELCIISMSRPELGGSVDALNARVSQLEAKLSGAIPVSIPAAVITPPEPTPPQPVAAPVQEAEKIEDDLAPPWDEEPEPVIDPEPEFIPPAIQEEEPESEPEPDPEPQPEPETQQEAGDKNPDLAGRLIKALKNEIDIGSYVLLSSEMQATLEVEGDQVIIKARNGFAHASLNKPEILSKISVKAKEISGNDMMVKAIIEDKKAEKPSADNSKLDSLLGFGNVTIE